MNGGDESAGSSPSLPIALCPPTPLSSIAELITWLSLPIDRQQIGGECNKGSWWGKRDSSRKGSSQETSFSRFSIKILCQFE
jgi:hypothetical protein